VPSYAVTWALTRAGPVPSYAVTWALTRAGLGPSYAVTWALTRAGLGPSYAVTIPVPAARTPTWAHTAHPTATVVARRRGVVPVRRAAGVSAVGEPDRPTARGRSR
jgi:hypothetical protein